MDGKKRGRGQAGKLGRGGTGQIGKLGNKGKKAKKTSGEGRGEGGVKRRKGGKEKGNWMVRKGCEEGREGEKGESEGKPKGKG